MISRLITSPNPANIGNAMISGIWHHPKGTDIVIVKASGVTLNKAKLSSTVVLGGKAGEVKATDCEITGKVVKIHNSALVTSGSTSTGGSTGGSSGGSSGGGSSAPAAPSAYPLPKGQETSKAWAYSTTI